MNNKTVVSLLIVLGALYLFNRHQPNIQIENFSCSCNNTGTRFGNWNLPELRQQFDQLQMITVPQCTTHPDKYVRCVQRLEANRDGQIKSHQRNDQVFSNNLYNGFVHPQVKDICDDIYQDFYYSDYFLRRLEAIIGKRLYRLPLAQEWKPTMINGRIHRYNVTTDKQGAHFDRKNFAGNVYTAVYTIYGHPDSTQTLRCWPKNGVIKKPTDIKLTTNTLTVHKCSDIFHEVLPSTNLSSPHKTRYCAIFQFTDVPPTPRKENVILSGGWNWVNRMLVNTAAPFYE